MADDAHAERWRQHEDIMKGLARIWAAQHECHCPHLEINADVKTALARIEPLMARMIPTGKHGREA